MRIEITKDVFIIRPAAPRDIEAMRAIERRAAQKFRDVGYDFCADGPVRAVAEHETALTAGATFAAETAGGALAGFAMAEPLDGEAHLVEIDVDPDWQGKGLGRRLIAAVEDWARGRGLAGLTLTTYRDIPWNAPFYARLGFEPIDPGRERPGLVETIRREAAWGFAFAPRVAMRKTL